VSPSSWFVLLVLPEQEASRQSLSASDRMREIDLFDPSEIGTKRLATALEEIRYEWARLKSEGGDEESNSGKVRETRGTFLDVQIHNLRERLSRWESRHEGDG
jgi:hypothetical protein